LNGGITDIIMIAFNYPINISQVLIDGTLRSSYYPYLLLLFSLSHLLFTFILMMSHP
jgi:hypothetical protein